MTEPKPAYDPTARAVSARKVPMTPEQLDALRPKPVDASQPADTAKQTAYRLALPLEIILRIEALERRIGELYCDVHDSEETNQREFERRYRRMLEDQKKL